MNLYFHNQIQIERSRKSYVQKASSVSCRRFVSYRFDPRSEWDGISEGEEGRNPQKDYGFLKAAGVSAIFGPGTNILEAAREILGLIRSRRAA
jgi:hypothetical protein